MERRKAVLGAPRDPDACPPLTRVMVECARVSATVFILLLCSLPLLAAQALDSILPHPTCNTCRLEITARLSLGEESGQGFVDWPSDVASGNGFYFVVNRSAPEEVRVFDSSGRFVRLVGGVGQGPGEFREIWDLQVSRGDTLHIIDIANLRRTRVAPGLEVAGTNRLPCRPMKNGFAALPDGGFLLNCLYPSREGALEPLHRMDGEGRPVLSFPIGKASVGMQAGPPEASVLTPVLSEQGRVFVVSGTGFSVAEWTLEGEWKREMVPYGRDWRESRPGGVQGYDARIQHLRVDESGRLWVLVRVADPNWEAAVERTEPRLGGRPTVTITDHNGYWDSVIEVWDVEKATMVVGRRFPEFFLGFLESGGVFSFRVSGEEGARIDIHTLRIMDSNRDR